MPDKVNTTAMEAAVVVDQEFFGWMMFVNLPPAEVRQARYAAIIDRTTRLTDKETVLTKAMETLRFSRQAMVHEVPSGCWVTGPNTGDPIQDLVSCPGCSAIELIDAAVANAKKVMGL